MGQPYVPVGYDEFTFTHDGRSHRVFRAGTGPAVVVLHEMPGLHPGVVDFARGLLDAGHTVYLPSLFGRPGEPRTGGELRRSLVRVCVSREFTMFFDRTSRVVSWLRGLAVRAHAECGGRGVGVVGMCFTGGFALATAVEPSVLAAVMSQPSLPVWVGPYHPAGVGLDPHDLRTIADRAEDRSLCALGLRFTHDSRCPPQRFDTLRKALGAAFEEFAIDSDPGNPHGIRENAHSVLTVDLDPDPAHPTQQALRAVFDLLRAQLGPRVT